MSQNYIFYSSNRFFSFIKPNNQTSHTTRIVLQILVRQQKEQKYKREVTFNCNMLKPNQKQRQSRKSKKQSVVKRKNVVILPPSTHKTSIIPPSAATLSSMSSSFFGSSSSSSSSSSLLSLNTPLPEAKIEYDPLTQLPMAALRTLLQSPSNLTLDVEEEEETEVYVDRRSYAEKMDFFDEFQEIPDIEYISKDGSVVDIVEAVNVNVKQFTTNVPEDDGKFVDPLLGIQVTARSSDAKQKVNQAERLSKVKPKISEPKSIPTAAPKPEPKPKSEPKPKPEAELKTLQEFQLSELMISESQTLGSQASELNDLELPDDTAFSEVSSEAISLAKEMDKASEGMLETFLDLADVKYKDEDKDKDAVDWYALAREREARNVQQQTKEFLAELIHKVVDRSEFRTKEEVLAENLDKRKLLVDLAEKCLQFKTEVGYNRILERKVVDFLKRKQLFSQIKPSKLDKLSKPKYHAALWEIEKQLARESATRNKYENTKNTLQEEIRKFEMKSNKQIQAFEELVKLKLCGNHLENLNCVSE